MTPLDPAKTLILDTETRGLCPELGETSFAAACAWLSEPSRVTVYRLDRGDDVACLIQRIGEAEALLGFHLKFDLRQLIVSLGWPRDVFRAHRLVDVLIRATYSWPSRYFMPKNGKTSRFGLKVLTAGAVGMPGDESALKSWLKVRCETLYGKNKRKWTPAMKREQTDYSLLPDDLLVPYLIGDIVRTALLYRRTEFALASAGKAALAQVALDESLIPTILHMELAGMPVSARELDAQIAAMQHQIGQRQNELGWDCSKKAEMEAHFGDYCDRFRFYTKKPSRKTGMLVHRFDVESLKRIAREGEPLAEKVLAIRHFSKRLGTYGKVWKRWQVGCGKIHCGFNIVGTHTGRWSSSNPNLQNIPKDKTGIKLALIPEPGHALICADWSAQEFLSAAHLSNDRALLRACLDGDVHVETAKLIFGGLPADAKTDSFKRKRQVGKTFNYASLYGAAEAKLISQLEKDTGEGWPVSRIAKAVDHLRGTYANLNAWRTSVLDQAGKGVPQTDPWGRAYRPLYRKEYAIINWLIQGFSAGAMKRAVVRARAAGLDIRLVVHDELVVMCPTAEVERVADLLRRIMSDVEGYEFPVDVQVGLESYGNKRPLADVLDHVRAVADRLAAGDDPVGGPAGEAGALALPPADGPVPLSN